MCTNVIKLIILPCGLVGTDFLLELVSSDIWMKTIKQVFNMDVFLSHLFHLDWTML